MKPPLLFPLVLSATFAWGGQAGSKQVLRDLGPDKALGVCRLELQGAGQSAAKPGVAATVFDPLLPGIGGLALTAVLDGIEKGTASRPAPSPYSQELATSFRSVFEQALGATGAFQVLPSERLVAARDGKRLAPPDAARENGLFACVDAQSVLGLKMGFRKEVKVKTTWQILGASGWKIEIPTEVVSEEAYGTFVNTADPELKPVFVRLARTSARQFLERLDEMMKAAGSPARMTIGDPDEIAIATLLDPGTLPQPEPDCALNADGKWEKRVTLPGGVDIALVYIPPGSFLMGSATVDSEESQPQHQVTVGKAFWLGKYEVTQAQWRAVLGSSPSKFKGDNLPVESVAWNDSKRFLAALNERLGLGREAAFRLPTEAEWEYACRTGTASSYSFSESSKNLGQYAWFDKNSSGKTHPAGALRPNAWGVYDMYGNVAEWCEDAWHDTYENAPVDATAWTSEDSDRVYRGGSWDQPALELRSHYRDSEDRTDSSKTLGFRLVLPARAKDNGGSIFDPAPALVLRDDEIRVAELLSARYAWTSTNSGEFLLLLPRAFDSTMMSLLPLAA